ncbi:MAG: hypothetical protein ACI9LN_003838 [Saprospiraceae bacterium]
MPENPSAWSDEVKRTFYLYQNASIYGGFNGTETALDQRDPAANVTVLSGDIDGNDLANDFDNNRADNVLNLVYINGTSTFSVLDGFTISGGHADGNSPTPHSQLGGGIFSFGLAYLRNCTVEGNYSLKRLPCSIFSTKNRWQQSTELCFTKQRSPTCRGCHVILIHK